MRISDWSSDVCSSDLQHRTGDRDAPSCDRRFRELFPRADRRPPRPPARGYRDGDRQCDDRRRPNPRPRTRRTEEHTSELQSLMRNSYAVFCLKKKITTRHTYKNSMSQIPTTTHLL